MNEITLEAVLRDILYQMSRTEGKRVTDMANCFVAEYLNEPCFKLPVNRLNELAKADRKERKCMDIDEAIEHAKEISVTCENNKCAFEHSQLAEWLIQFKVLKSIISDNQDIIQLKNLIKADKEGRCVISPCAIGDIVYHITICKYFPEVLDGTLYDDDGGFGTATGLYCPCELNRNCPFPIDEDGGFDCEKHKNTYAVFEDEVNEIFISDEGYFAHLSYSGFVDFEDFGRTVFLTREEAEQALKEREQNEKI